MNVHTMKAITFQKTDYKKWQDIATKSLRGLPFDNLLTKTIEGIDLQPLYTKENCKFNSSTNNIRALQKKSWVIAQPQYADCEKAFLSKLVDSIERGNEAIVYDGKSPLKWTSAGLNKLAKLAIDHPLYFKNIKKEDAVLKVFELIREDERHLVQGAVSLIGIQLPQGYINIRTIAADVTAEHLKGADAITELALVIAQAAEKALAYQTFEEFSKTFFVRFAIDTHFFMEMAKIRAFRLLWQTLGIAFGSSNNEPVPVLCETSLRSYSKLDPYVNLLRAGNQTFAAVLGGADVITVHPHDYLLGITSISERLARNVQLVIKEETVVNEVVDPAGGSYFMETLTTELVEEAWQLFLFIDENGGYTKYSESGKLAKHLQQLHDIRMNEISTGKHSLIGTNVYADLGSSLKVNKNAMRVTGRLAEPFEKIRSYFNDSQPKTVLLNFGELKDFKPRADFVSGFLATGGIHSSWSPAFSTAKEAIEWLKQELPNYVVVCGKQDYIEGIVPELLHLKPKQFAMDVAGSYEEDLMNEWTDAGLNGFIYNGQNKIEKLHAIRLGWESLKNEKT